MTNERILAACVMALMECGFDADHAHALRACPRDGVSVTVTIHNNADVPTEVLAFAKGYAAAVFRRGGVVLRWLEGQPPAASSPRAMFTVVLLAPEQGRQMAATSGIADEVVGQAASAAGRAYIHYERVVDMTMPPERTLVTFLGYVMAHELGHLMLRGQGHASAGIMRSSLPRSSRSIYAFTAAEAALICAGLENEDLMPLNGQRSPLIPTTLSPSTAQPRLRHERSGDTCKGDPDG